MDCFVRFAYGFFIRSGHEAECFSFLQVDMRDVSANTHYLAAEASATLDTGELATGMTAAFTHDGNAHAASASRLAPSSVALSP
jgi:hypothetical protein